MPGGAAYLVLRTRSLSVNPLAVALRKSTPGHNRFSFFVKSPSCRRLLGFRVRAEESSSNQNGSKEDSPLPGEGKSDSGATTSAGDVSGDEEEQEAGSEGQPPPRPWAASTGIRWRELLLAPDPDNVVAVGLTGILALASLQVLWQILLISLAILVAALKYSFVAALLLFILITLL